MRVRVGIPRTLGYYTYFPFWRAFFSHLGATCVVSEATTKATLDHGIDRAVSEACVPIKLFFGHMQHLIDAWKEDRVDAIFVPRLVSWERATVFCPKFLGLPDMVRHAWNDLPPLISPRIDNRRGLLPLLRACDTVRRQLGAPPGKLLPAYREAVRAHRAHLNRLKQNRDAERSIASHGEHHPSPETVQPLQPEHESTIRLAVLGYPYLVYDEYVSLGVLSKLREMGAHVMTAEALQHRHPGPVRHWSKPMFWTYSSMVARAGVYALDPENDGIDGVIHVTAFSCGPDAIVDKLLEIEAGREGAKPFLSLGLDEQTGEAGCLTRLEAFVDMLRRKRRRAAVANGVGSAYSGPL